MESERVIAFPMERGERQVWIGGAVRDVSPVALVQRAISVLAPIAIALLFSWFMSSDVLLFVAPVIALGLVYGMVRMAMDLRRQRRTTFALTTRRAIVSVGDTVTTYPIHDLHDAEIVENKDKTYNIEWGLAPNRHAFEKVDGAFEMYDSLRELTLHDRAEPPSDPMAIRASVGPAGTGPSAPRVLGARDKLIGAGFFAVFAAFGIGFGYLAGWPALRDVIGARRWTPVPCEIVSSGVRTNSDSDGQTYSVDVRFSYDYEGRHYTSDRYQLTRMSQGGIGAHNRIQRTVAALPAGLNTTCWLDPARPDRAVIDRGMTLGTVLFIGLPVLFSVVGLGGMLAVLGRRSS